MRAKWKAQFPKSKRAPDAIGFKNFSDERFLNIVEAVYVPALKEYVEALETKAKTIDKGHQPTHLLKQAHQQLERVTKARDERAKRVEAAQKKKREAKVNKKRSKAVARGSKSAVVELSQEDKAALHCKYFDFVKELWTRQRGDRRKLHHRRGVVRTPSSSSGSWPQSK